MNDEYFMKIALKEAKIAFNNNEIPVGAVIVKENKIIARAHNIVKETNNCLNHAELLVINKACKKLKYERLNNCSIYVTLEPCYMCAGAIFQARIEHLIYGTANILNNIEDMNSKDTINHTIKVKKGVLEEDCKQLIDDFFKQIRKN
ncbi:MAG: nucleoside deaminase [Bacilli bacterium]